jgi:hypothetical protein
VGECILRYGLLFDACKGDLFLLCATSHELIVMPGMILPLVRIQKTVNSLFDGQGSLTAARQALAKFPEVDQNFWRRPEQPHRAEPSPLVKTIAGKRICAATDRSPALKTDCRLVKGLCPFERQQLKP